ncbi:MAG: hypothetical protein QOH22_165, partial [Gemmatimonadaceae bacterium]|nr:hypothetical protein [Gemmatimonadaceae bacterium]
RALLASVLFVLLLVLAWATSSGQVDINPIRVVLAMAGLALSVAALVVWGGVAAWSWIVAALAYQGLGGIRNAAYGAVWQERLAGALSFIFAVALLTLIARRITRAQPVGDGLTHI